MNTIFEFVAFDVCTDTYKCKSCGYYLHIAKTVLMDYEYCPYCGKSLMKTDEPQDDMR